MEGAMNVPSHFGRNDLGNTPYAGQNNGAPQQSLLHPQSEREEKKKSQSQVVYTTAGTPWVPDANKPLQPPFRRGRMAKYALNAESATFHPSNQLAYSMGGGPLVSRPIPQYEPLQQNDDRAVSPPHAWVCRDQILSPNVPTSPIATARLPAPFGGLGVQADPTFAGMAPGIIVDGEHGVYNATDELMSKLSVKSLANLASYPNPSQEKARRALREGQRLQPTLPMEGIPIHVNISNEAVADPGSSTVRPSPPGVDQLARPTTQPDKWRLQEQAPEVVAPHPNRQAIQALRFQQSQALGNGAARIMPAGGYSSTALATGPGAPEPLKAGPPGQRQKSALKLGNASTSSGMDDHRLFATAPEKENPILPGSIAEQGKMQFHDAAESGVRRGTLNGGSSKPHMEVVSLESDGNEGVYVNLADVASRLKAGDAVTQGPLSLSHTRIVTSPVRLTYEQNKGASLLPATKGPYQGPYQGPFTIQGAETGFQKYQADIHAGHAHGVEDRSQGPAQLGELQRALYQKIQGIAAKELGTAPVINKIQNTNHDYLSYDNKDIAQQHMGDAEVYAGMLVDGRKHPDPMTTTKLPEKPSWEAMAPHGWDPSQYSMPYFGTYPYGAMRMSDEQLHDRQEKVDAWFYSNTSRLGTSMADALAEREQTGRKSPYKHPRACPFGAIGEGRSKSDSKPKEHHNHGLKPKPKQTYEHMGLEEANALPVAQHAKPLLNVAFQAILDRKDAEAAREQPKYKRTMDDGGPYTKFGSEALLHDSLPDGGWAC